MRSKWIFCVVLGLASAAYAKDPQPYQTGTLTQMDSVPCGTAQCQEYVLQTEHVTYRIRPRDEKHTALLPVDERAQFRLQKNKMLLRLESANHTEHEYIVVSMAPLSDSTAADATPVRLNHLQ